MTNMNMCYTSMSYASDVYAMIHCHVTHATHRNQETGTASQYHQCC